MMFFSPRTGRPKRPGTTKKRRNSVPKIHYTGTLSTDLDLFIQQVYGHLPTDQHVQLSTALAQSNPRGISTVKDRLGRPTSFTHSNSYLCLPDIANLEAETRHCQRLSHRVTQATNALGIQERKALDTTIKEIGPKSVDIMMSLESFSNELAPLITKTNSHASGINYTISRRLGDFTTALKHYDETLKLTAPGSQRTRADLRASSLAFERLQRTFRTELSILANSNRYSEWIYNPYRSWVGGMEAAVYSPKAPLESLTEVNRLKRVLKATHRVGKGLLVIDIGLRSNNVLNSSMRGRQAGEEAFSFGTAAFASWAVYKTTMFGIGVVFASTPYGWLVIFGALSLGALAAYLADSFGRDFYRNVLYRSVPLIGSR